MKTTGLEKAAKVLAKLGEVAHWIGAVGCVVGLVLTFVLGSGAVFGDLGAHYSVPIYGFSLELTDAAGAVNMTAVRLLLVAGIFLFALMAMVCRNTWLILKNSENATPFTPDNVRMVREIGIFFIAMPVVSLIMDVVSLLVLGVESAEASVDLSSVVVGLVVLCLSRIFARGMALENDVDGLV